MYFDALETRSFEELYQVCADDYSSVLVEKSCPDARLRNVLLRNEIITARDLFKASPSKVLRFFGFGRLTACLLRRQSAI